MITTTDERYGTIIEISKKIDDDRSNLDYLDRGMAYYQAGMDEILRTVAEKVYYSVDERPQSKPTAQLSNKADDIYKKLQAILPDEHHNLLLNCDDAYRNWGTGHGTDEFINGFLACFKFFNQR